MHIAIVSPYDPRPPEAGDPLALRGGVEEALDRTASGLARLGHEVTVVTSAPADGVSLEKDGVRFVRVKRRGIVFRTPIAPLHAHVPREADILHVPATYPFVSDLVPWREARRGRPTVLDYHFDPHGTSAAMRLAVALHRHLAARLMLRATRVVAKSLDYARHSRVLSRVPTSKLDWVPNAIDPDEFAVRAVRGDDILCVGRLVPYKGVDVLVRAMPRVHRETGAFLDVVGSGPEAHALAQLADRIGAPVRFHGRVPRNVLARMYASARLTVLPSVNSQEAFGIALLESMAAGTPVVASDLPGVREVAALGGTVAPAGDPTSLAGAIVQAWRNPDAFGTPDELRARVARHYSWNSVVARWVDVYARARATPSSAPAQRPHPGARVARGAP